MAINLAAGHFNSTAKTKKIVFAVELSPIEQTLDHLGSIARTVSEATLLLNVIAGSEGLDPRQSNLYKKDYLETLDRDIKGIRIGIVKEGFNWGKFPNQM